MDYVEVVWISSLFILLVFEGTVTMYIEYWCNAIDAPDFEDTMQALLLGALVTIAFVLVLPAVVLLLIAREVVRRGQK